jgi:hypothetical protein
MKAFNRIVLLALALLFTGVTVSNAQLRENRHKPSDYMGPIVKERSIQPGNLGNLFNMQMDHSYSMMFSSMGGRFQNLNAYTNTMRFFFTERLTGRLDVSLLHSPFGNTYMSNGDNGFGGEIIIRNAELNYQLGDNSSIQVQFQQMPSYGYGYGMNPWFNRYHNPFDAHNY